MKAVIIHQADYSMTRMVNCDGCRGCGDLPETKNDAEVAKVIAKGLGIKDKDILVLENMNRKQIDTVLNKIKKEFQTLAKQKKRSFVYVYAAGHGAADQM